MSNNFFRQDNPEPWDQETYQIGTTQPPKNHGGIVVVEG